MEELFGIDVKKNILGIAQKYHNSKGFSRDNYVTECMRIIATAIKKSYGDDLQYFDLFMLEYGKFTNLASINFQLLESFSNPLLMSTIQFNKQQIQSDKIRSFVKLMNRKTKNGIVLYENDDFNIDEFSKQTDTFCFDLKNSIRFEEKIGLRSLDEYFEQIIINSIVDVEAINKLFQYLEVGTHEKEDYTKSLKSQKLYPLTINNLNAYFIRPRIANISFNGVFYLQLTIPLTYQHYNEITEIITQIYCEVALWRSRSKLSKQINNSTSDEYSHFLKHEFSALCNIVADIQTESENNKSLIALKERLYHITKLNDFHLHMVRASEMNPESIEVDPKTKDFDNLTSVYFRKVLEDAIFTIDKTLQLLNIEESDIGKYKTVIESLKEQILKIPKVYLKVKEKGLYLILVEALKNAFEHSKSSSPNIFLEWQLYDENHYYFKISNNSFTSKEDIIKLNSGNVNTLSGKRDKIGLKTIYKISNFKYFNYASIQWHIFFQSYFSKSKKEHFTYLQFLIPKEDTIL